MAIPSGRARRGPRRAPSHPYPGDRSRAMDKPDNPVVLVTGGAGNLGRAVTHAFLAAGWRTFIPLHQTDRRETLDQLGQEFGAGRVHGGLLDLTTERGAASAVQQSVEWGGRLDAVAHLMGAWSGGK